MGVPDSGAKISTLLWPLRLRLFSLTRCALWRGSLFGVTQLGNVKARSFPGGKALAKPWT